MRDRLWVVSAATTVALIVIYFLLPSIEVQDALYVVVGLLGVMAMAVGILVHRPRPALPFAVLTAGLALVVIGEAIWIWYEAVLRVEPPYPGIADVSYLLGFPTLFVGAVLLVRNARDSAGVGLEAWIIALGASVPFWQFFIAPAVFSGEGTLFARVLSAAYPAFDIFLVAIITRLLLAGLWRNASLLLLGAGFSVAFISETLYALDALGGGYHSGVWYDGGWLLEFGLLGTALLHPSVRGVGEDVAATAPVRLHLRLVALAVAGLVAPTVIALELAGGTTRGLLVVTVIWAVLFLLVVTRMRGLMGALDSLFRQMRHRAHHDPLTGLENRTSFTERVEAALANPDPRFAIAYLDLDGFKDINDADGHLAGDAMLVTVADRLLESVRHQDAVARIGGDEFAVFAPDLTTEEQENAIGIRLVAALAEPVQISTGSARIAASIGLATARPGDTFDALLARADSAMYRAKRRHVRSRHPTPSAMSR